MASELITLEELSERTDISEETLAGFAEKDQIPYLIQEGKYLFPYEEVLEALPRAEKPKPKLKPKKKKEKEPY